MPVLKNILLKSKDGEWGKAEGFDDSTLMYVIRGTDFESARIGKTEQIPQRYIANRLIQRKKLQPYDIIIETAGGSKNTPTGRTLFLKPSLINRLGKGVVCASFARFLRINPKDAEPSYIFWLLQHLYNQRILFKYHTQHTGVARFQYTTFASTERLILPDRTIQRSVASILSAYDDLIENNTRRIAILEEMARRIYQEWFVNFRFPGHENVRMVDSELGKIPKGWEVKTINESFNIMGGGTPSKKINEYWQCGDINWYAPSDLTKAGQLFMEHSSARITELGLKKSSAKLFPPYSVMMTSRATLGVVAINTTEAATNQGFITCIPSSRFPVYFLYHWLLSNMAEFTGRASGTTFKEITKGVFKNPSGSACNRNYEEVQCVGYPHDGVDLKPPA